MDRDDIIRMAREVWGDDSGKPWHESAVTHLEAFAALVAAAKESKMIEGGWRQCAIGQRTTQFCGQVEQAVAAEREACAKVCEELLSAVSTGDEHMDGVWDCIAAIRARGQG